MDEIISYNGKMMQYAEYNAIQKKLYEEMVERSQQYKLEGYVPPKIINITKKLSIEESQYLLLGVMEFIYKKLCQ